MLKGIGPVNARNLVAYCGGVDPIFTDRHIKRKLEAIPGIKDVRINSILDKRVMEQAGRELEWIRCHEVRMHFYLDDDYPRRLRHCEDAPVMLFVQGNADLNAEKMIAVVGTRSPSEFGGPTCEHLIHGLSHTGATIISGMAYGIDIVAHREAMRVGLPTIGCMAHGLKEVFPIEHHKDAKKIKEQGALVTEFSTSMRALPGNFPARNRIIAGLADCTVVVESGRKGGSLITADIAQSYDRDVFAFPGRATDGKSEGCNKMIQESKAALITSAADLIRLMEWAPRPGHQTPVQSALFVDLKPEEQALVDIIRQKGKVDIDELCHQSHMPQSKAASLLLNLEFNGVVRSLPGKLYTMN